MSVARSGLVAVAPIFQGLRARFASHLPLATFCTRLRRSRNHAFAAPAIALRRSSNHAFAAPAIAPSAFQQSHLRRFSNRAFGAPTMRLLAARLSTDFTARKYSIRLI